MLLGLGHGYGKEGGCGEIQPGSALLSTYLISLSMNLEFCIMRGVRSSGMGESEGTNSV
jgi:hypothetical protein